MKFLKYLLIAISVITILNLFAIFVSYFINLSLASKWYEQLLVGVVYGAIISSTSLLFGMKRNVYIFPLVYLILSIILTWNGDFNGVELIFLLNSVFNPLFYFIYGYIHDFNLFKNDTILLNGLFFIFQLCIFAVINFIYKKLKY